MWVEASLELLLAWTTPDRKWFPQPGDFLRSTCANHRCGVFASGEGHDHPDSQVMPAVRAEFALREPSPIQLGSARRWFPLQVLRARGRCTKLNCFPVNKRPCLFYAGDPVLRFGIRPPSKLDASYQSPGPQGLQRLPGNAVSYSSRAASLPVARRFHSLVGIASVSPGMT